jgi:hypothetical protein
MKEVMKIEDSFLIEKTGLIVSGINYQVDALTWGSVIPKVVFRI